MNGNVRYRRTIIALLLLGCLMRTEFAAFAQEEETSDKSVQHSAETFQADLPKLEIGGFLDASYIFEIRSDNNTFGFDQAEINLRHELAHKGSAGLDLEWLNDGQGDGEFGIEQAFITFSPLAQDDIRITFGKFNSPIGLEAFDPPDMYQHSYGLVSNYALPGNLTGLSFAADFGRSTGLCLFVTNGWDNNLDFNDQKTFGGRLDYNLGGFVDFGLGAISGSETDSLPNIVTVADWLVNVSLKKAIIGAEVNFGWNELAGEKYQWNGFLAMTHIKLTPWLGVTGRYDYFNDGDALRLGSGVAEKRQAITIAPVFWLSQGLTALLELRHDISDQRVFSGRDGSTYKSATAAAFEMTYGF